METLLGAVAALVLAVALAYACGYGIVSFLLRDERSALRLAAMPVVGYTVFSLVVMAVSGNFGLSVGISVWIAFAAMLVVSAAALVSRHRARAARDGSGWKLALVVVAPTLVVVLGPALIQGNELYLGSVNLDYYQSLIYAEVLRMNHLSVFGVYRIPEGAHSAVLATRAWPESLQARFGAVMFAFLLKSISPLSAKSALTAAMEMFALCLPLSVLFFSRAVLGLTERVAALAAVLTGISAPLTMSFLYVLVGQSSGLPVLPLLVAVLFLTLTRPTPRLVAMSALLVWGLFWLYALMLPFALAPMGLLGLWLLARRRLHAGAAATMVLGLALVLLAGWGGMFHHLVDFLHGLSSISGRLVGTVFFVDFLTELFFVYFFGVTTYTFSNSLVFRALGTLAPGGAAAWAVAVVASAALIAFVAASIAAWWRAQEDRARRLAVLCLLGVYCAVWAYFTFAKPYGYSAFKMAVWLQFAALPFVAFGIAHFATAGGAARRVMAAAVAVAFCAANLAGSLDYDQVSFGTNRERGYIVNAFGVGGNPDWASLGRDVAAHVKPSQTIGLGFTDAIQNDWAAYRLTGIARQSILSHAQLPEDDSFLPDPVTGSTSDTSGAEKTIAPLTFDDVRNDFFLLPGARNLNPEIVEQSLPPPVWSDGTFQLQDGAKLHDFLFLGRGFYREGFPGPDRPWWQPEGAARWMRTGGEFYLYQAAHPGMPYRISFTAMVGFGYPSASRTLEFWHDGRKFDEVVVTDVARIVSKPFLAHGGLDRVTVVIKEHTRPFRRALGLWNRDVPEDTRSLNLYVSSARLEPPGDAHREGAPVRLDGAKQILGQALLFNGLSAGGWVNERASLSLVAPFDHARLALDVMVPGNLGFAFPYRIAIAADGIGHEYVARAPGVQHIVLELPHAQAGRPVDLDIRPQASRRIPGAFSDANRPVTQSVLLQKAEFSPAS